MNYLPWKAEKVKWGLESFTGTEERLGNLSPIDFVLKYYPESQMYKTHTFTCF